MVLGTEHKKCLSDYGSFALHNLNRLFQNITLSYHEKFKLFDCLVGAVLSYAAEVWGFHKSPDIERLHLKILQEPIRCQEVDKFVYTIQRIR